MVSCWPLHRPPPRRPLRLNRTSRRSGALPLMSWTIGEALAGPVRLRHAFHRTARARDRPASSCCSIFGPKRLPGLGRQLGTGMREFKDSITGKDKDDDDERDAATSPQRRASSAALEPRRRPSPRWCPARRAREDQPASRADVPERRRGRAWPSAADRPRGPAQHRRPPRRAAQPADRLRWSRSSSAFSVCYWQNDWLLDIVNKPLDSRTHEHQATTRSKQTRGGRRRASSSMLRKRAQR